MFGIGLGMIKYSIICFLFSTFACSCSSSALPFGHMLGKNTPLVFEVDVTKHLRSYEKRFWISDKGMYKVSYSWSYEVLG